MATGQRHVLLTGQTDRQALVLGSYEPDEARTGVPAGTSLTPMSGQVVITTAGATYDGIDLDGWFDVRAPNVTIRNCRINGASPPTFGYGLVHASSGSVTNLLIEDCTIACTATSVNYLANGIMGHDFTARRNRILNVTDGIGVFNQVTPGNPSNVIIEGNRMGPLLWYASVPDHTDGSHNDVIQFHGGVGTIARYNTFLGYQATDMADGAQGGRLGPTETQSTSCIIINSLVGDPFDIEIYDNWVYGGEVCFNCGNDALGVPGETVAIIHRNKFKQGTQWYSTVPLVYEATATWDFGEGTANANVWMDSGLEIPLQAG